jgi:threonine synthase
MKYLSTRSRGAAPVSISQAIRTGQAPDGGLYRPERLPKFDHRGIDPDLELADLAAEMLAPFFEGDPLTAALPELCREAYAFPAPLAAPDPKHPGLLALELFHGPTGAFKDFGARFLMGALERMGGEPLTVLTATAGDTGGAVGCAAEGRRHVRAAVLYPEGRVSPFQEHQLTCWGEPVEALRVTSDFDACQALVKAAFSDPELSRRHRLTSANSINMARLLPQTVYLASAAMKAFARTGEAPGLILPTGNLGHGVAALYARSMGFPIGPVVLATNANPALSRWAETGRYEPAPSIPTIANAMDVGAPSNFERLTALAPADSGVSVHRIDDDAIRARITADHAASGYVWCPHSATAAEAYARLPREARDRRTWIAAATAHPFKFADIVEPLIGRTVEPTEPLAAVLGRPAKAAPMRPDLAALDRALTRREPAGVS